MTDKASPKGWVVQVTTKRRDGGPPAAEIYDVAIADAADAVEAVRRACGGPDTVVEIVAELPSGTDLRDGEVLLR